MFKSLEKSNLKIALQKTFKGHKLGEKYLQYTLWLKHVYRGRGNGISQKVQSLLYKMYLQGSDLTATICEYINMV